MAPGVGWGELFEDGKTGIDQRAWSFQAAGDVERSLDGAGSVGWWCLLGTSSSPVPCHVLATRMKQMEERC